MGVVTRTGAEGWGLGQAARAKMSVQCADANTNAIKHGVNESFQQQQQQQPVRGWGLGGEARLLSGNNATAHDAGQL